MRGLGLLPTVTVFNREKTRTRVAGAFGTLEGSLAGLAECLWRDMRSIWERPAGRHPMEAEQGGVRLG